MLSVSTLRPYFSLLILLGLIWFFSDLAIYISIAMVLSIIGRPLVNFFKSLNIKRIVIGQTTAAVISLLTIIGTIVLLFLFLVPLLLKQASLVTSIDTSLISAYYQEHINSINAFLSKYNLVEDGQQIGNIINDQLHLLLDFSSISLLFGQVVSTTSTLFMALFIILFLSFFFLKEPEIIKNAFLALTPYKYADKMRLILKDSRIMLSRYFIGLLIEVGSMMFIISLTLTILGINNGLLIGFIGGLMNIIPYLGPLIGAAIGATLGVIYVLAFGMFDQVGMTIFIILVTFAGANIIDNFVLQPVIYSRSVKAHPVEIFLVIIVAGKIAGITGMIAAIPTFTVIKVIARQFAKNVPALNTDQSLTLQNIDPDEIKAGEKES